MILLSRIAVTIIFIPLIAACSNEEPVTKSATPKVQKQPDALFDAQKQVMEAARQTELIIDKAAKEREKQMEE